jgi:hypothetical protein
MRFRHFDTTEVMEAETQAVLNSLTEQDFQEVSKKMAEAWERRIRAERELLRGRRWSVSPKLVFYHMAVLKKTKLHGLSPRANYTDRATAACHRSDCQLVRIEGAMWSA